MSALRSIESWPVDNAAGCLITDAGAETVGDTSRVFALASVTKPLAAYAILVAVEEGVFDLDSPLGPAGSTVRHLLAHASGVAFDSPNPERAVEERRLYSSAGFDILADAVAAVADMSFAQYLREAVCEPLGMKDTTLQGSAGHGASSAVQDMAAFVRELLAPTLVAPATMAEATTVQFPELAGIVPGYGRYNPCPWGLGFEIKGQKNPHWTGSSMPATTFGHFGQSGTFLWIAEGRGCVVLTDRAFGPWAKPLWQDFNDELWGEVRT